MAIRQLHEEGERNLGIVLGAPETLAAINAILDASGSDRICIPRRTLAVVLVAIRRTQPDLTTGELLALQNLERLLQKGI